MKIGLTGGVASGKSTVARHFASLGVAVIDADQIARDIVEPGQPALATIVDTFGPSLIGDTGHLDRKLLGNIIFSDPDKRLELEAILHPAIADELVRRAVNAGGPYQVLEIPLLVETGITGDVERVLVVDCPEAQQIDRLIARDGSDQELARQVLEAQATRTERLAAADDVIVNTGPLLMLADAVRDLDKLYRQL